MLYGGGTTPVYHETFVPSWHPFLPQFWNGTCDEGQLTAAGLADAVQHGKVRVLVFIYQQVYIVGWMSSPGLLVCISWQVGLSRDCEPGWYSRPDIDWGSHYSSCGWLFVWDGPKDSYADMEGRYSTFAGTVTSYFVLLLNFFSDDFSPLSLAHIQIDSLPPDYSCPLADSIRNAYQSVPAWTDHLQQNQDLQTRLDETLGTTGLSAWNTWCSFLSFFYTYSHILT